MPEHEISRRAVLGNSLAVTAGVVAGRTLFGRADAFLRNTLVAEPEAAQTSAFTLDSYVNSTRLTVTDQLDRKRNPFYDPHIGFAEGDQLFGSNEKPMSEAEIEHRMKLAADLGATAIRFDCDGELFQPHKVGEYDWTRSDRIVEAARKHGMDLIATVTYVPVAEQYAPCQGKVYTCPPANSEDLAVFAKAVARRYKDKGLRKFEIWNEPNLIPTGSDPTAYAGMFNACYDAIKLVIPDAAIALGAVAGILSGDKYLGPADFIDGVLSTPGIRTPYAVFDNAYSHPDEPDQRAWWNPFEQIEGPVPEAPAGTRTPPTILSVLKKHGLEKLPILITEFGVPTGAKYNQKFQALDYEEVLDHRFREAIVPGRYAYFEKDTGNKGGWGILSGAGKYKLSAFTYKHYAELLKKGKLRGYGSEQ